MIGYLRASTLAAACVPAAVIGATPAITAQHLGDATVAQAQLEVAREIRQQATLIVAIAPQPVEGEAPHAPSAGKQNYTVTGIVTRCFKGRVASTRISYVMTSEGRPAAVVCV